MSNLTTRVSREKDQYPGDAAHPVYLDEPVADESELVISQRCKSAEQVPPMTQRCTLPDHRDPRKHTKNLQTSSADLIHYRA